MKRLMCTRLAGVAVTALALALAGCGGSSNTQEDPPVMPDPAIAETEAIEMAASAVKTATAPLGGNPTQAAVNAAKDAIMDLQDALGAGTHVSAAVKAGYEEQLATAQGAVGQAETAIKVAADAAAEKMRKEMAAAGKALHGALGPAPLGNLDRTTNPGGATLVETTTTGLTVDQPQGSLAADPPAVTLEAGDPAGALGAWKGMNYAHMNAGTEVSNTAVVYTNQDTLKPVSFADAGYPVATETSSDGAAIKGYVLVVSSGSVQTGFNVADIMADAFRHSGTQEHTAPDTRPDAVYIRGSYDGALGEYRCASGCSSTNDGKDSRPTSLGGTWHFRPDSDAMVPQLDDAYLYFGWWLTKNKDGEPASASAFFGEVGDVEGTETLTNPTTIAGSATYSGHAAGKFAITDPLHAVDSGEVGDGNAGHFTADVMLTAKFGTNEAPNNGGVSGTIDNFMANDKSVPWSVELQRAQWGTSGAFASIPDDSGTTDVNEATGTVWSIDGNKAAMSGNWNGQMHDEALAGDADDGSNIPTSAVGVFQSVFGSTHTMVGAFGAEKND